MADASIDWLGSARLGLSLAILTAGNSLAWLGWDQRYDVGPSGVETGPYQPWQVAGLVIGLGILAAYAGWRRRSEVAIVVSPAVMTLCFSLDAAADSPLRAVGAALVALATLIGASLVAGLVTIAHGRAEFRSARHRW